MLFVYFKSVLLFFFSSYTVNVIVSFENDTQYSWLFSLFCSTIEKTADIICFVTFHGTRRRRRRTDWNILRTRQIVAVRIWRSPRERDRACPPLPAFPRLYHVEINKPIKRKINYLALKQAYLRVCFDTRPTSSFLSQIHSYPRNDQPISSTSGILLPSFERNFPLHFNIRKNELVQLHAFKIFIEPRNFPTIPIRDAGRP